MESYSAVKKKVIMKFVEKWMKLKNILNEVTKTQKNKYHIFFIICGPWF